MLVRDYMTHRPWVATASDSALEAAAIMEDRNCGLVPIVRSADDLTLLGVVTDRDLFLALCRRACEPASLLLGDCIGRQPITCAGDMPIADAAARMRRHRIRRLMVVDGAGRIVGVLALADLARAVATDTSISRTDLAEVLLSLSR